MFKKVLLTIIIAILLIGGIFIFWEESKRPSTFSLIVLPDTQKYSEKNPKIFCKQTEWIVEHKIPLNIQFVSHMGDIVEHHKERPNEWGDASLCMGALERALIPYGIIPGNHDTDTGIREDGLTMYDHYFPASRYEGKEWYRGNRKGNQNNYEIITVTTSAGPIELLFLNLEIEPSDNTIAWANEIVKKNSHIYTILTTHKYLPDFGNKLDTERKFSRTGNTGQDIWDKLVKNNCSIKLVLNGHFNQDDGENMLVSKNSCGRDVYQVMQDYQSREAGGNGRLRIYTFDAVNQKTQVKTYSPYIESYETDADSEFVIPFDYR